MDYVSTRTFDSQTCPGVTVTYRKMTVGRRIALEEKQSDSRVRLRAVQAEMAPLSQEYRAAVEAAKAKVRPERDQLVACGMARDQAEREVPLGAIDFDEEKLRRLIEFGESVAKIDREELTPVAVGFAVMNIAGLTIDGDPALIENLLYLGPDELYEEIAQAVAKEMGLSPGESENLQSPSTSGAAVEGSEKPGNAPTAAKPATTRPAAAPNITARASVTAASTK